jgi:hypothetical protein
MAIITLNNNSLSSVTLLPAAVDVGAMVKLQSTTVSSATASVSWNSTYITSTYDVYKIFCTNIIPSTNAVDFGVGLSTDNLSSNGNIDQRTSGQRMIINDSGVTVVSQADFEQANAAFTVVTDDVGSNTGESFNGEFTFYQPSGSSYKYWTMVGSNGHANDYSGFYCVGSQIKTTSAVNGILMKFVSGNIASGILTLYGVNN